MSFGEKCQLCIKVVDFKAEEYLEPSRTSAMKIFFAKIIHIEKTHE